tara:strand:- start:609 stop:758 length:150 start_codon:yes stop_codon:yes gene_type:complete
LVLEEVLILLWLQQVEQLQKMEILKFIHLQDLELLQLSLLERQLEQVVQ